MPQSIAVGASKFFYSWVWKCGYSLCYVNGPCGWWLNAVTNDLHSPQCSRAAFGIDKNQRLTASICNRKIFNGCMLLLCPQESLRNVNSTLLNSGCSQMSGRANSIELYCKGPSQGDDHPNSLSRGSKHGNGWSLLLVVVYAVIFKNDLNLSVSQRGR